jgi:hypothetical protein
MMTRIMAIGDLHLGGVTHAFHRREILSLQCEQLRDQLVYAIETDIKHVVLLGDVFDVHCPPQDVVAELLRVITDEAYSGLNIYMYLGNHDTDGELHAFSALEFVATYHNNLHVFTSAKAIALEGGNAVFMPYPQWRTDVKNSVVFIHKEFKGTKRDNGHVKPDGEIFDAKYAAAHNQMYVSGHLHTAQTYPHLVFTGTSGPLKYLPRRKHYIGVVELAERRLPTCKLLDWGPYWRVERMDVSCAADEDLVRQALDHAVKTSLPTRLKVVAKNHTLSKDLREHPHIALEGKIPAKFTQPSHPQADLVSNVDWVEHNLPDDIKRNKARRRFAHRLMHKVERG